MLVRPSQLESFQEYLKNGLAKYLFCDKDEAEGDVPLCAYCLENEAQKDGICDECRKELEELK
jgi:hypothetical protein